MRTEFRGERDRVRERPAEAEAGEETDDEQTGDILGEDGGERADSEGGRAEDDDLLAPDTVGDRAENKRADHQTEEAGAEHGSERAASKPPVAGKVRRDVADGLRVEAIEEEHGGTGQKQADLKAADRLFVDEAGNVDHTGSLGHGPPSRLLLPPVLKPGNRDRLSEASRTRKRREP